MVLLAVLAVKKEVLEMQIVMLLHYLLKHSDLLATMVTQMNCGCAH